MDCGCSLLRARKSKKGPRCDKDRRPTESCAFVSRVGTQFPRADGKSVLSKLTGGKRKRGAVDVISLTLKTPITEGRRDGALALTPNCDSYCNGAIWLSG